jgi:hypothetical protein
VATEAVGAPDGVAGIVISHHSKPLPLRSHVGQRLPFTLFHVEALGGTQGLYAVGAATSVKLAADGASSKTGPLRAHLRDLLPDAIFRILRLHETLNGL